MGWPYTGKSGGLSTLKVWLCQQAFTPEEYEALEPPEECMKSGIGLASHDAAFFRRSPQGNQDNPLATMVVQERNFSHVAIPGEHDSSVNLERDKVLLLDVHKHHSVMFAKGRTLEIITMDNGLDYAPRITEASGIPGLVQQTERVLPKGCSIREITLKKDVFVEVPFPARVCFFASGHSFQGPVSLADNYSEFLLMNISIGANLQRGPHAHNDSQQLKPGEESHFRIWQNESSPFSYRVMSSMNYNDIAFKSIHANVDASMGVIPD